MPPRSVSPGPGGKKAIARKRQMPSGALSGLRVIGALLTLLIMSVLLDETATCIDYVWEAMSVKFVLLAYVLAMFLAAEHARKVCHDANSPHPMPQSQLGPRAQVP